MRLATSLLFLALVACDDKTTGDSGSSGDDTGPPSADDTAAEPVDADGDGYSAEEDCDDSDAAVNPAATEVCDELDVDEDCDGAVNDDDPDVDPATQTTWYADSDGDGFGDVADAGTGYCDSPGAGWSNDVSDCDDSDAAVNPAATEVCDEFDVDEDCNGAADDDDPDVDSSTQTIWLADDDGDGYGDDAGAVVACDEGPGRQAEGGDCDDTNADVNPGAYEDHTDGVDNDCDGNLEETWWDAADAPIIITASTNSEYTGYTLSVGDFDGDGVDDLLVGDTQADINLDNDGAASLFYGPLTGALYYALDDADAILTGDRENHYMGFDLDIGPENDLIVGGLENDDDGAGMVVRGGAASGVITADAADLYVDGAAGSSLGWFVAQSAGDIDDDGVGDAIFGAPDSSWSADEGGAAFLFSGLTSGSTEDADADWIISASDARTALGVSAYSEVDLDGDGVDDLLLGSDVGDTWAFYGPLSVDLTTDDADLEISLSSDSQAGEAVAAGDIDGDGYADIAVGAPYADIGASSGGSVYLFAGPVAAGVAEIDAVAELYGSDISGNLGRKWGDVRVADFDGDAYMDLLVGARYMEEGTSSQGLAFILQGPLSGVQDIEVAAHYTFVGLAPNVYMGNMVGVGDLDGDGLQDFVTGAHSYGAVFVFPGSEL